MIAVRKYHDCHLLLIENCIKKEIHFRGETKTDSLEHNNLLVEDYCNLSPGILQKNNKGELTNAYTKL